MQPSRQKAPHAAKLMREIAERRKITKAQPARLAEIIAKASEASGLPPLEDPGQVYRWWKGEQRIGLTNRERLKVAFPEFASDIEAAMSADTKTAASDRARDKGDIPPASPDHAEAAARFADLLARLNPARASLLVEVLDEILDGLSSGADFSRYHNEILIGCARARQSHAIATAPQQTSVPFLPHEARPPEAPGKTG